MKCMSSMEISIHCANVIFDQYWRTTAGEKVGEVAIPQNVFFLISLDIRKSLFEDFGNLRLQTFPVKRRKRSMSHIRLGL